MRACRAVSMDAYGPFWPLLISLLLEVLKSLQTAGAFSISTSTHSSCFCPFCGNMPRNHNEDHPRISFDIIFRPDAIKLKIWITMIVSFKNCLKRITIVLEASQGVSWQVKVARSDAMGIRLAGFRLPYNPHNQRI